MYSIWLTGVSVPLILAALTVGPGLLTGIWYFPPLLLGVWMGTSVWIGQALSRDATPPRWGSRSDLLGRLTFVVAAACSFGIGVQESRERYGSVGFVYLFYGFAAALLVFAFVAKPEWIRALTRKPKPRPQVAPQTAAR
jgi:hypothetical protein